MSVAFVRAVMYKWIDLVQPLKYLICQYGLCQSEDDNTMCGVRRICGNDTEWIFEVGVDGQIGAFEE